MTIDSSPFTRVQNDILIGGTMTSQELEQKEKEIRAEIGALAQKNQLSNANLFPIYDGIYSAQKYLSAPLHVMWLLKEPYDDSDGNGNFTGGGWSIPEVSFKNPAEAMNNKTYKMVARLSYCLLNEKKFEETKDFAGFPEIATSLQSIAFCNISKMPAGTTTDDSTLPAKYELWKSVVLKQIRTYEPDVILFGGTFNYAANDLFNGSFPDVDFKFGAAKGFVLGKSLCVSAYHPAFAKNEEGQDNYASEIIKVVKMWKSGRN